MDGPSLPDTNLSPFSNSDTSATKTGKSTPKSLMLRVIGMYISTTAFLPIRPSPVLLVLTRIADRIREEPTAEKPLRLELLHFGEAVSDFLARLDEVEVVESVRQIVQIFSEQNKTVAQNQIAD